MLIMKRFLIAILALSTFPFDPSAMIAHNDYQPVELIAPQIREETDLSEGTEQAEGSGSARMETTADEQNMMAGDADPVIDIVISFTGDCTIGSDESYRGYTFDKVYNEVKDPGYFFQEVRSVFESDDYTFINLEGVFTDKTKKADKEFRYKGPPEYCEILVRGGVDGCNLANNHTLDYLQAGFDQTVEVLNKAGIDYTYMDKYLIKEIKGVKIGFLGYKGWSHEKNSNELLKKHVKEMREQGVAFIITNYHWGDMYTYYPNTQQRNMAHFAIDNGADLVIGHHPHVLQGMETYKGKNIVYSLGNFCYGGKMNPSDKDTIIFQQIISFDTSKNEIAGTDYRIIPASISSRTDRNNFQPRVAEGEEAERILKKFASISEGLN